MADNPEIKPPKKAKSKDPLKTIASFSPKDTASQVPSSPENQSWVQKTIAQELFPDDLSESLADVERLSVFSDVEARKSMHWSVAWSNLMMVMFIMFVVLYVYAAANRDLFEAQKEEAVAVEQESRVVVGGGSDYQKQLLSIYALTRSELKKDDLGKGSKVTLFAKKAVQLALPSDTLFQAGTATLTEQAEKILNRIAPIIRQNDAMVNIAGHTDNAPFYSEIYPGKWELTSAQAASIVSYLTEVLELPPTRFFASGHAQFRPVKSNDTPDNMATNRRVEIIIWLGQEQVKEKKQKQEE